MSTNKARISTALFVVFLLAGVALYWFNTESPEYFYELPEATPCEEIDVERLADRIDLVAPDVEVIDTNHDPEGLYETQDCIVELGSTVDDWEIVASFRMSLKSKEGQCIDLSRLNGDDRWDQETVGTEIPNFTPWQVDAITLNPMGTELRDYGTYSQANQSMAIISCHGELEVKGKIEARDLSGASDLSTSSLLDRDDLETELLQVLYEIRTVSLPVAQMEPTFWMHIFDRKSRD